MRAPYRPERQSQIFVWLVNYWTCLSHTAPFHITLSQNTAPHAAPPAASAASEWTCWKHWLRFIYFMPPLCFRIVNVFLHLMCFYKICIVICICRCCFCCFPACFLLFAACWALLADVLSSHSLFTTRNTISYFVVLCAKHDIRCLNSNRQTKCLHNCKRRKPLCRRAAQQVSFTLHSVIFQTVPPYLTSVAFRVIGRLSAQLITVVRPG